jgi:hypothetical protein
MVCSCAIKATSQANGRFSSGSYSNLFLTEIILVDIAGGREKGEALKILNCKGFMIYFCPHYLGGCC